MRLSLLILVMNYSYLIMICKADCEEGWFGPRCLYECHCTDGCDINGLCGQQTCGTDNWFGYKCQYSYQSMYSFNIRAIGGITPIRTNTWQDNDDSTCLSDGSIKRVVLFLKIYPFFYFIRLIVGDSGLVYKFIVSFETDTDTVARRFPCQRQMFTVTNNRTVDIRCENIEVVDRVILDGEGVTSLCSIYVSSGRNTAARQPTEQTSTNGTYYAWNAVDGDISTNPPYESCTLTNETDVSPTWTVTFNGPVIVNFLEIYSRDYLYNSRLQAFDKNNVTVIDYSMRYPPYKLTNNDATPIQKIQITATNNIYSNAILSICEVITYGACSNGHWDMDCKQQCNSECPDFCNEWDGACPSACLGYYAPSCTKECTIDKWGVNCREDCSDRCQYKYCNSVDGLCTAGCNGYSDPPYCTKSCTQGYYGANCGNRCSANCPNAECDKINGTCLQTCQSRHQGPFCDEIITTPVYVNSDQVDKTNPVQSTFSGSSFGIGFGVCVGVVVIAIVVIAVVIKFRPQKENSRKAENVNTEDSYKNVDLTPPSIRSATYVTPSLQPKNLETMEKAQVSDEYEYTDSNAYVLPEY